MIDDERATYAPIPTPLELAVTFVFGVGLVVTGTFVVTGAAATVSAVLSAVLSESAWNILSAVGPWILVGLGIGFLIGVGWADYRRDADDGVWP